LSPALILISALDTRQALLIGIGLMFVQQLSGINAVMFYCGTILQSVFTPSVANTYAAPLMDKAGRIPILLFAALGQCCACGLLGVYYLTIQVHHWTSDEPVTIPAWCKPVWTAKEGEGCLGCY
jgi:hypothetical protein